MSFVRDTVNTTALVHEAYVKLAGVRQVQIVECRFFAGMTIPRRPRR